MIFGSSPLSRGIQILGHPAHLRTGIIPALAGNTAPGKARRQWVGDHPRSRGEYSGDAGGCAKAEGSSPLSRGILYQGPVLDPAAGIIPALAGNTIILFFAVLEDFGSSPLSRGIPELCQLWDLVDRIIPALAGNTSARHSVVLPAPDHPRSRGEYHASKLCFIPHTGSSPLSRGIRHQPPAGHPGCRIIPALAGNTLTGVPGEPLLPDHPRSRGEYLPGQTPELPDPGSSPLSRGIPQQSWRRWPSPGIIPALAGNTMPERRRSPGPQDHPRSRGEYTGGGWWPRA